MNFSQLSTFTAAMSWPCVSKYFLQQLILALLVREWAPAEMLLRFQPQDAVSPALVLFKSRYLRKRPCLLQLLIELCFKLLDFLPILIKCLY